jgi:hypothetical protein
MFFLNPPFIALTLTLPLSHQGRGGKEGLTLSPACRQAGYPSPLSTGRQAPREKGVEGYHREKPLAIILQFLDFLYRILGYNVPHEIYGKPIGCR